MIIAFCGKKRVGKDVAAETLVKNFNFTRISFADPLKEVCSLGFDLPKELFFDDNLKDKPFDKPFVISQYLACEILDELYKLKPFEEDNKLIAYNKLIFTSFDTPRQLLQFIGTDIVRNCIDINFWLEVAKPKLIGNVVITDCRMKNEREFIRSLNGTLVLINRPNNTISDNHFTENDLGSNEEYQVVINNDDSLIKYTNEINLWMFYYLKGHR